MASTLFPLHSPCRWLPDETLYSLCSRHHHLSGNVNAGHSALELFGPGRNSGCKIGGLEELSSRAGGHLGSAIEIAHERTLRSLYQPFMPPLSAQRLTAAMLAGTPGGLRQALDCDFDGVFARHPLRACLRCAESDVATFHVAYWHRRHQWPGVYRCLRHRCPLMELVERPMHPNLFPWLLPSLDAMRRPVSSAGRRIANALSATPPAPPWLGMKAREAAYWIPVPRSRPDEEVVLVRYAELAIAAGENGHRMSFMPWVLARLYRKLFDDRSVIMRRPFDAFSPPPVDLGWPEIARRNQPEVVRLTTVRGMPRHPVCHLLALTGMGQTWDSFIRQYDAFARGPGGSRPADLWNAPIRM